MKLTTKLSLLALASTNLMFGDLIYIGEVPNSGGGFGSVSPLLTLTSQGNSTVESACVGFIGGATTTDPLLACPAGFNGLDPQPNNNNTYEVGAFGLNNFNSLQLIFNASEPGNANSGITIDNLALTLYSGAGLRLATFSTVAAVIIPATEPGIGNAGFGFALNPAQANQANGFLGVAGLRIGGAINASDATGGQETVSIRFINDGGIPPTEVGEVPEPSTYAIAGISLIGLAMWNRKKRS